MFHRGIQAVSVAFLFLVAPFSVHAATLLLSPAQGSYEVGDTIRVKVLVSTDVSVNAVSGLLNFSSGTLSAESASKSGSFLSFWTTDPTFSNSSASLSFEGVSPGTGYTGSAGTIALYTFRASHAGTGSISFQSGSVLANDGQGTNVLNDLRGATFTITAPAPKPTAEPVVPAAHVQSGPEPAATTTAPTSDAPIITLGVAIMGGEETQVVHGLSKYPNALATLYFGPAEVTTLRVSIPAGPDGSFTIPLPTLFKPGLYSIHATVARPEGAESLPSDELAVRIPYSLASYAWQLLPYISIGVLIILIVAAIVFIFWYASIKLLKKQHALGRDTHEAQVALHKSFEVLRQDIADHLKEIRKSRTLDAGEEKDVLVGLKKDIDDAEGYIKNEIDESKK